MCNIIDAGNSAVGPGSEGEKWLQGHSCQGSETTWGGSQGDQPGHGCQVVHCIFRHVGLIFNHKKIM